jgi:hypothetical protein
MMEATGKSFPATWVDALTKPREKTYTQIGDSPRARATTAYLWVFLAALVTSFVTLIAQGSTIREGLSQSGMGAAQFGGGFGSVVLALVCGAPIAAVLGTLMFGIGVALVQWLAMMFGGSGSNDRLAYTMAAISVPYSLVTAVFVLLSVIPYVGFCFQVIPAVAGIYVMYLDVLAVKAVNRFGWGPAIGSLFIPWIALFLVCCVVAALIATLTGVALGSVLSGIQ